MAKLTARFDIQDRISKKLRAIRGEIDSLQKARDRVNKPVTMSMRVKDMATKILKRTQMFVLKDLAKTHAITLKAKDGATKTLTAVSNFMKRRMPKTHAVFVSAKDKASPVLQKVGGFIRKNIARTQILTILATDRAMPVVRRVGSLARSTLSRGYNFTVRGVDMASRIIGRVSSYAMTAIPRVRTFTIRAINAAGSVIGSVKRALFSIPTLITVTLAAVGIGKLKESTVGAAMNFEGYEVSMDHWLKGNKKASQDLITWMGQLADKTPFSSPDLFPALTRGIGLADGDVNMAKNLLKTATDMAALTPGSTVIDAMEALGDGQMGEFERLKAFNMKFSKKDLIADGWDGIFGEISDRFKGGSEKLSATSEGIISTLQGYKSSIMRSFGTGFLDPMKPRLNAISAWLDNNQDKWQQWKSTVMKVGSDASEWLFSKLESGFSHMKTNYLENDTFKNLDFEGKIKFISEDIGQWWNSKGKPALNNWWESSGKPWAEKVGLFMGESIFNGIVLGIKEGGKALGNMWKDAFKDPSLGSLGGAGIATILTGALASLVLSPLIKGIQGITKVAQGTWGLGKKVAGLFGGKGPKTPKQPKQPKPNYTMPWTNRGEKPGLNVPNAKNKGFKMPKGLSNSFSGIGKFAKRVPIIGTALGALSILTAKKEDKAKAVGGVAGGVGGAIGGAALGTAIFPGVGTAIGGILGGIGGSIAGGKAGDWFKDNWSSIKEGASDAASWIGDKFKDASDTVSDSLFNSSWWVGKWNSVKEWGSEKLSDTSAWWTGVKEAANSTIFSGEWWAEKVGFVYGVLESTLFSADWWSTQWDSVKTWTSEKWDAFTEVWNQALEPLKGTIFSAEWWGTQWEGVKTWTSEKWNSFVSVWDSAKTLLSETLFSAEWWGGKWGTVKTWTQEQWDSAAAIWESVKTQIGSTLFSSDWWGGKWEGVKGWTQSKWDSFTSVWNSVKEQISSTLFSQSWWSGKWDTVKGWASSAWSSIKDMASGLGESFNRGRTAGKSAASYAKGTNYHPGGPAIVGDGGGSELIRYPNGKMSLSPDTDTMMNLPRGTEVLSHRNTVKYLSQTPEYADGVGFNGTPEKASLPEGQVAAATQSPGIATNTGRSSIRDIILKFTGDNHYTDDMDAEKVGKIAYEFILKALEEERFAGGEMAIYE